MLGVRSVMFHWFRNLSGCHISDCYLCPVNVAIVLLSIHYNVHRQMVLKVLYVLYLVLSMSNSHNTYTLCM